MALWGTKDSVYSIGVIDLDYANKTITGTATSFTAASVGDVISIGVGNTFGEAVIESITDDSNISIASTDYLNGQVISGVAYTISQKPKYTLGDSNYSSSQIFGADEVETQSNVAITHAGWVGIITYVDAHGNLRTKTETLVAMSGISTGDATYVSPGDAADDTVLPDRSITISIQPSSSDVGVGTTAQFSVSATATPSAPLTYQWYEDSGSGFAVVTNTGDYSGATTATLSIENPDATKDGYEYRVVITATGGAVATSDTAILGVTV